MRAPRSRAVIGFAATVLLIGVLAVLFAPSPNEVELTRTARGAMTVSVSSDGKTQVKENYEVTAPIAGRLLRIEIKAGDPVVGGQTVVAMIEPPQPQFHDARSQAELEAKVRVATALHALAKADLERAKAEFEFAQTDLMRNRTLSTKGAISARALEQSELDAKTRGAALLVAQNTLEQRASELESAKASLISPQLQFPIAEASKRYIQVRAPVSGRVLNVLRESETVVTAGMPLITLGDPRQLEVVLEMLSEDAVKVREGATAMLEGWGGEKLNARVRRVEPYGYTKVSALGIEEQRVKVRLDFTDPPEKWQSLGHGYRVNAKIAVWKGDDVIKLPMGALFRDGSNWAAYTVTADNLAQLKHITVGHLNDQEAEVLDGLAEGDPVILHPSDRIANGVPVKPKG